MIRDGGEKKKLRRRGRRIRIKCVRLVCVLLTVCHHHLFLRGSLKEIYAVG